MQIGGQRVLTVHRQSRWPREARAAASTLFALAALALSGCVFLVDSLPDNTSTTCHLTTPEYESTGPCATCITTSCQPQLNACCADTTCQGQLSNVDECGAYDCAPLSAAAGTNATTGALVACIAASCKTTCSEIDAGGVDSSTCSGCSDTSCATNGEGTRCDCNPSTTAQPANSVSCDDESVENGVCCATSNYPAAGSSCDCVTMYCENDTDTGICACEVGVFTQGEANLDICTSSSGDLTCCLSADHTRCDCDPNDLCDQVGETQVSQCDSSNMGCAPSVSENTKVSTCSGVR